MFIVVNRVLASALVFVSAPLAVAPEPLSFIQPNRTAAHAPRHPSNTGRRPRTAPCGGPGASSFVGGGTNNIAGGEYAGVLEGGSNEACDNASAVGGGFQNTVAGDGVNQAAQSFIGGGEFNTVSYSQAFIGAGYTNSVTAPYSFIGAGSNNQAEGNDSFVGSGYDNVAQNTYAFVGAGAGNTALSYAFAGAGLANKAEGIYSFIGAGYNNQTTGAGSFIGGGGTVLSQGKPPGLNSVSASDAFIGAGDANTVGSTEAFLGGDGSNTIELDKGGSYGGAYGVIGGGFKNTIDPLVTGGGEYGVIAGGVSNFVYGNAAAIGGGSQNRASGQYGTVPGGLQNSATGVGSFAAGTKANAAQNGSFVWSDDAGTSSLSASAPYEFLARASGGFFLYSNAADSAGVELAPGSGTWAALSDRTMKTDIVQLEDARVLAKVAALPVSAWSYRTEDPRIRHIGPMAQDFYAAFGVGEDDRHITSIDEDGVALAAIKALHAENARLQARNVALQARLARDERNREGDLVRLMALEKHVASLAPR